MKDNMRKGWEMKKLGEVCDISAGGDVPKDDFSEFPTENRKIPIYANGEKNNGLYGYTSIAKVLKPSITVSARGTIGYAVKRLESFYPIVRLIVISPKSLQLLDLSYLDFILKNIDFKSNGTSIPQLTVPMIKQYEIPIPPLPEQQRIVSILDEAFGLIEKAKLKIEKNLQNAQELFQSELNAIFENGKLKIENGEWKEKTLGEIIEIKNGKNQQQVLSENGQYPVLGSAGNVMGYATDYICEAGTTIIGRKGNISKPIYIENKFWNVDTAFGFYPRNENDLDKKLVYYLCLGIDFKSMNRGTTIPSLVKSELQKIKIHFPKSFETQQKIVQQLDKLSEETKRLEAKYQQKLDNLEELKKSILQKAFSGELI